MECLYKFLRVGANTGLTRLKLGPCCISHLKNYSKSSVELKDPEKDEKNLERLKNFLIRESKTAEEINREFAQPFFNISNIIRDVEKYYKNAPSENILFRTAYEGKLHKPSIDMKYILSSTDEVAENLKNRKLPVVIDIRKDIIAPYKHLGKVREEKSKLKDEQGVLTQSMKEFWIARKDQGNESEIPEEIEKIRIQSIDINCKMLLLSWIEREMEKLFYEKALLLPNKTHPSTPVGDESEAEIIKTVNKKPGPERTAIGHLDVGEKTGIIHQKHISNFTGQRTYFLRGAAADLEQALVRYTLDKLKKRKFELMLCPNIFHGSMFEACGVANMKIGSMLYRIDSDEDHYIAGTSEVGIATYFANHAIPLKNLPIKLCSVSTCNRRETDNRQDPRGLFRVHHFTKVEMFGVTANETGQESEELFQEFMEIQEEIFGELELPIRVVNMPTMELGLPAYQKVDMEAWMSARGAYGEISSTSNCTDFQSRRLHILYKANERYRFAHTLNGTACAVPRVLMALLENNQTENWTVNLPKVLHPYLDSTTIQKSGKRNMEYIGPLRVKNKLKLPD